MNNKQRKWAARRSKPLAAAKAVSRARREIVAGGEKGVKLAAAKKLGVNNNISISSTNI